MPPVLRRALPLTLFSALLFTGCTKDGDLDSTGGINVTRSACPAVAVPAQTGDITLFNPEGSTDSRAIDVVAVMTNVRHTCSDAGADVAVNATFDVIARRSSGQGARQVIVPYFGTVVRAGRLVVSKSISRVAIDFADGETRATGRGSAGATINRAAATLPEDIRERITRKRKVGDADAAIDPMADPVVREAVSKASFELLVGFQLTEAQLRYNATR
jgi:hypothetical protein